MAPRGRSRPARVRDRRAVRALRAAVAALLLGGAPLAAQEGTPTVEVFGPEGDTLRSATPTFTVVARNFPPGECAIEISLQIATSPDFTMPLVERATCGDSATFTLDRPLPEDTLVYWRGRARIGELDVRSAITGPRRTARWLTLLFPNLPNGTTIPTRRPAFTWRSAEVVSPPGPWVYAISITNVATRQTTTIEGLADTVFVATPGLLESNTSYRWSVSARLSTGDSTRVASASTFVIVDANAPLVTILYQNWPNPFPSAVAERTCFWFDLARPSAVRLDVYDLRGHNVQTIMPGPQTGDALGAGRYGRAIPGSESGCDPRFSWDGTDRSGRAVPAGIYIVRLRAGGEEFVKRIVFRGR